jgi:DUF2934 family protein
MDHRNTATATAPDLLLYDPMEEKAIAQLAYTYWEERGKPIGAPNEDWFRAEQEIKSRRNWRAVFGHEPAFGHEHWSH